MVFRPSLPPAIWTIRSMRSPGLGRARFSLWARWIAWVKMGGMAMPAVTTVTLWRRKSRRLSMMASSHQLALRAGQHQIDGGAGRHERVQGDGGGGAALSRRREAVDQVHAGKPRAAVQPRHTAVPAGHVGWIEELVVHARHRAGQAGGVGLDIPGARHACDDV